MRTSFYTAPEPAYSRQEPLSTREIITVGPMVWRYAKALSNRALGRTLSPLILPALNRAPIPLVIVGSPSSLIFNKWEISTHDGATLDALELIPNAGTPAEPQYIIYLVGNGSMYQDEKVFHEMVSDAQDMNSIVIGFNYRGVGYSTGYPRSKDDLVVDGIAQVQRLLDAGVNPHHITLKGHSLGGSIATLVTAYFHQQGIPINLFNDRSFSTITNVITGHIRTLMNPNGHEEGFFKKLLGWSLKPIVKTALTLTVWEINADDAYHTIPLAQKQYIAVRTSDNQRNHSVADDPVITDYGSLHEALTVAEQHTTSLMTLDTKYKTEDAHDVLLVRLVPSTHRPAIASVSSLDDANERKPLISREPGDASNASDYFRFFVQRSTPYYVIGSAADCAEASESDLHLTMN